MTNSGNRLLVILLSQVLWLGTLHAETVVPLSSEFLKQDKIYRSKGKDLPEGYTTDRALSDYTEMLTSGFDRALANLGSHERWLDIGAGQGKAIMDYYSSPSSQMGKQALGGKAAAVAISIEDRRSYLWQKTAAGVATGRIQYLYSKRLRDYSPQELGQFQLITDVIGGFSYTDELSLFLERVLDLLAIDGSFYTVLADVKSDDGTSQPYYTDSPFTTAITNADGLEVSVCSWLKSISCVEVACERKKGWRPPIEAFHVRKVCNDVKVPVLVLTSYEAATPPGRQYRALSLSPLEADE